MTTRIIKSAHRLPKDEGMCRVPGMRVALVQLYDHPHYRLFNKNKLIRNVFEEHISVTTVELRLLKRKNEAASVKRRK